MSRRLLDVCLLAYPRARRERDRDYLRDLALDLADADGLPRQAISLLLGGLKERIESRRRSRDARRRWARRAVVACFAFVALMAGYELVASAHELEEFVCVHAQDPPSQSDEVGPSTAWECTRA